MFITECPICHKVHKAEKINDSVLDLKHHPECSTIKQKVSWTPIIKDTTFD